MFFNLIQLAKEVPTLEIKVSVGDLMAANKVLIADTKRDLEEAVISNKAETYPTPKQVSEILNVDLSTLWRWHKKGYLVPITVGGKRRYKMSEVKAILNGGR